MPNIHYETKFGQPSKEALALPFSPMLPTDKIGLMKVRVALWERCLRDEEFRRDVIQMCAMDLPFFVLIYGWLHETRGTQEHIGEFPAFLDPDQIDILAWWQKWVGQIDICNEKTRGIGFSYLLCFLFLWLWLFSRHRIDLGLLSKDEQSLDRRDKPGSLMGKLDLMFAKLPPWLKLDAQGHSVLKRSSSNQNHVFHHNVTLNNITGYVPTNNKLRSDRLFALGADEARFLPITDQEWLAAAHGTVDSVIWVSTHQGRGNMFYRMTQNTVSNLIRISSWWWENRRCRRGLYRIKAGRVEMLDTVYRYPDGYFENPLIWEQEKYVKGRLRSAWVDRYFLRPGDDPTSHVIRVLEEYYALTSLVDRRLLREEVFQITERTTKPPMAIGHLRDGDWIDDADGPVRLWFNPDRVPAGCFFIGVDPGLSELGGAYKVAAAFDAKTGQQVLVARYHGIDPTLFPKKVVELATWLSGARGSGRAQIAFESNGPGIVFRCGAERLRYPALMHDEGKSTPGFGNNDKGAAWLLELGRAIMSGELTVFDEQLGKELAAFEWDAKEDLTYALTDGHGDTAIATALAWWGGRDKRRLILKAQKRPEHLKDPDYFDEDRPRRGRKPLSKRHWSGYN